MNVRKWNSFFHLLKKHWKIRRRKHLMLSQEIGGLTSRFCVQGCDGNAERLAYTTRRIISPSPKLKLHMRSTTFFVHL
jgi:hypothetical protein